MKTLSSRAALALLVACSLAGCAPAHPLIVAARDGDAAAVDSLLAAHEPLQARDANDETALDRAAEMGRLDIVKKLLDSGADLEESPRGNLTALMRACRHRGNVEVVRLLLSKGAAVNGRARSGTTPLMFAASSGRVDIAKILLAAGADPNARTKTGRTALRIARATRQAALVALLSGPRAPGAAEPDASEPAEADRPSAAPDWTKAESAAPATKGAAQPWWQQGEGEGSSETP